MRSTLPAVATLLLLTGSQGFAAVAPAPTPADNDAAARHAKLTACLKEAKDKKLVGAQKAAFIRECVAAR